MEVKQIRKIVKEEIIKREDKLLEFLDEQFRQINEQFKQINQRFEEIDQRFEQIDQRFEQIDQRFEQMEQNYNELRAEVKKINSRLDKTLGKTTELLLGVPLLKFKGKIIENDKEILKEYTLYLSEANKNFYQDNKTITEVDFVYTDGKEEVETVLFLEVKTAFTKPKLTEIKKKIKNVIRGYLKENPSVKNIFYGIGYVITEKEVLDRAIKEGFLIIELKEGEKEIKYVNSTAMAININESSINN